MDLPQRHRVTEFLEFGSDIIAAVSEFPPRPARWRRHDHTRFLQRAAIRSALDHRCGLFRWKVDHEFNDGACVAGLAQFFKASGDGHSNIRTREEDEREKASAAKQLSGATRGYACCDSCPPIPAPYLLFTGRGTFGLGWGVASLTFTWGTSPGPGATVSISAPRLLASFPAMVKHMVR